MNHPGGPDHKMRDETPPALPHPVTQPAIDFQQATRLIQIRCQALRETLPGLSKGFQSLESNVGALGEDIQTLLQTRGEQMREGDPSKDRNVCLPLLIVRHTKILTC